MGLYKTHLKHIMSKEVVMIEICKLTLKKCICKINPTFPRGQWVNQTSNVYNWPDIVIFLKNLLTLWAVSSKKSGRASAVDLELLAQ